MGDESWVGDVSVLPAWSKPPLLDAAAALIRKVTASGAIAKGENNMWLGKE